MNKTIIHKTTEYKKAIDILTSQGKFHICLGLERMQSILELLNNPQDNLKFIHVAGTNGKGSVCSMLSSIIKTTGVKVGLFTSPHVFEYTERIKLNDKEISQELFAEYILEIISLSDKHQIDLTEFEIITAAAFKYFLDQKTELVILETGLGGRLDATNVIKNNICSIITHIDLDHTERLGNTIEKIAYEKAGIIKEFCPVIVDQSNTGFDIINKIAQEKNSNIKLADKVPVSLLEKSALKGTYQQENLALVIKAVKILNENEFNIPQTSLEKGILEVKHPCRFEYLKKHNLLIDGAHNPDGAKVLRQSLEYYFPNQKYKFIFGCLKNKCYKEMMQNLFKKEDEIYFYHFDNPNSCTYQNLSDAYQWNSKPFDKFTQDYNTLTIVCGSFYMIKELLVKMGIK